MSSHPPTSGQTRMRNAAAIAGCVLAAGLIFFAFGVGTKAAKQADPGQNGASAAVSPAKKPAPAWNIALGNVVVVPQELGLSVKAGRGGSANQAKIAARIESQLQRLRDFYRQESEKNPALMGSMTLQITVEPGGEVTRVKEVSSRISNPEFKKNVASLVSQWSFRDIVADSVTIQFPLLFVREGMEITTLVLWERSLAQTVEKGGAAYGPMAEASDQSKLVQNRRQSDMSTNIKAAPAEKASGPSAVKAALAVHQLRFATSLRKEPNFSSKSIARLPVGTKLSLIDGNGDWLEVREESTGQAGFIRREFISDLKSDRKP